MGTGERRATCLSRETSAAVAVHVGHSLVQPPLQQPVDVRRQQWDD
jgi:hypothetical protein